MDKDAIRRKMIEVRQAMSEQQFIDASSDIEDKVITHLDLGKPTRVHIYSSIESKREVSTKNIIQYLKSNDNVETLHTFKLIDTEWRNVSIFDCDEVGTIDYDVVIIPMLAGDINLNRLGYGGGFYDRFLATQPKAEKIGLCFSACIIDELPTEPNDIKMDRVFRMIDLSRR